MGWDVGRRVKREGTYENLWLIHVDILQKPTQYRKAIILQLKINNFFKVAPKVLAWGKENFYFCMQIPAQVQRKLPYVEENAALSPINKINSKFQFLWQIFLKRALFHIRTFEPIPLRV